MLPEILRGLTADYLPRARRRPWGGLWEGIVEIHGRDGSVRTHVCDDVRESETDALVDAGVDALTMYDEDSE